MDAIIHSEVIMFKRHAKKHAVVLSIFELEDRVLLTTGNEMVTWNGAHCPRR